MKDTVFNMDTRISLLLIVVCTSSVCLASRGKFYLTYKMSLTFCTINCKLVLLLRIFSLHSTGLGIAFYGVLD